MATRLPASQRTREELTALIEERLSTASAKDELIKLASRLIVEEALEGEAGDALLSAEKLIMAISDVLSDAVTDILRHLEPDADVILAPEFEPNGNDWKIAALVLAMDRVRLSPGFDVPPDVIPPELPPDDGAIKYLQKRLAEHLANKQEQLQE